MTGPKPARKHPEVTPVPKNEQTVFEHWLERNNVTDLDARDSHYDYRGAFMANVNRGQDGHWPDTFKQHGHPTFSEESQYSKGPGDGGTWVDGKFVRPRRK